MPTATRLTDRASLRRALYNLVNTDSSDEAHLEHDATDLDTIYMALQVGLDDAQQYMIDMGIQDFWHAESAALSFTGSDPDKYWALPTTDTDGADRRFYRMYGDRGLSSHRRANGTRWGGEIDPLMRWRVRGNYFYLRNERLYLARSAAPPSDLVMDYIYRLPDLADGTTVEFPEADRPLIVAFAAVHAMYDDWVAGGAEMESKLMRNLESRKAIAFRRARRSLQPTRVEPDHMVGDHWFS